ncbi:MAG: thiamine-phosphate kinase [Thermoproteota archaeon]
MKGRGQSRTYSELGEVQIRDLIVKHLGKDPREILGYGEDAVAFRLNRKKILVVHTDALVGSTDVLPGMPPLYIGWKAVVMNVSDIVSKGAEPLSLLFSWGIPRGFGRKNIAKIAEGMSAAARKYGTYVTGGDTSEADDLILAGTSFGITQEGRLMSRSGARPGDILAVTGKFGLTSIGYKILLEGLGAPPDIKKAAIKALYVPSARLKEGLIFAKTRGVTACMDCSDGLARSLHYLAEMSGVGFRVTNIPIAEEASRFASMHKLDMIDLVLYRGGEEYELVVCVGRGAWGKVYSAIRGSGGDLYRIGEATHDKKILLESVDGSYKKIERAGWEHFSKWT